MRVKELLRLLSRIDEDMPVTLGNDQRDITQVILTYPVHYEPDPDHPDLHRSVPGSPTLILR